MQKEPHQTEYSSHYEKFPATGEVRCIDDEIPFDIPDTWEWVRLGEYVRMKIGKTPARGETAFWSKGEYPWVSISDMLDYGIVTKTKEKISKQAAQTQFGDIDTQGTLLMSFKLTVGRTSILGVDAYHNEAIISIYPYTDTDFIIRNYLFYVLPLLSNLGDSKDAIKGRTLNSNSLYKMLLPIPPLNEQYRIIDRIKELLPIINQYAKSQDQLDTLNTDIKLLLRKSILQEAIQGRLVEQCDTDEPASNLLERIQEEKKQLVKQGKLKAKDLTNSHIFRSDDNKYYEKCGNITTCIDDEIPFEIPNSWCWVRLGEIFSHCTGKALNASDKFGVEYKYITTSNVYWNRFELSNLKSMPFKDSELEKCTITKGDLLVCEGGDIGRAAIWSYDYDIKIQNHIHKLRAYYPVNTSFMYNVLFVYKHCGIIGGKGIGIQGLSSKVLHNILLPLPPLAEQQRIVSKIEQVLTSIMSR